MKFDLYTMYYNIIILEYIQKCHFFSTGQLYGYIDHIDDIKGVCTSFSKHVNFV